MPATVDARELLAQYRAADRRPVAAEPLRFRGVDGLDVYNVSGPFAHVDDSGTHTLIAGRVEPRDSERSTVIIFTASERGVWQPLSGAQQLDLQDPFVFHHAGVRYLGGVELSEPTGEGAPARPWRTIVVDHSDPFAPTVVFQGPWGMKDLRFVDLADGRLGVLTRPQGGPDGRGRIGFTVVDSLAALTIAQIDAAPRLEALFLPEQWGGVNHAWLLTDGRIGLLGHIALFGEEGERHYYPMAFQLDPLTLEYTLPRILFERSDLPPGPAKRPDLTDVVFPGWVDASSAAPTIYCGVGDAAACRVDLSADALETVGA